MQLSRLKGAGFETRCAQLSRLKGSWVRDYYIQQHSVCTINMKIRREPMLSGSSYSKCFEHTFAKRYGFSVIK